LKAGGGATSTILYVGTHGVENPARATMPFAAAVIAAHAGDEPQLLLRAWATALLKDVVAKRIHAEEWPALPDLLARIAALGIPVYT
jgi:predicted peroxiredoxin